MGFKPMSYENLKFEVVKLFSANSLETDPNEPLRDWPDPRGQPQSPWLPDKTSLQGACEALKRECEEIEAKRAEKVMSGSLEDIRKRLMIK